MFSISFRFRHQIVQAFLVLVIAGYGLSACGGGGGSGDGASPIDPPSKNTPPKNNGDDDDEDDGGDGGDGSDDSEEAPGLPVIQVFEGERAARGEALFTTLNDPLSPNPMPGLSRTNLELLWVGVR